MNDQDIAKRRCTAANIPPIFHKVQLKDVDGGEDFKTYVNAEYKADKENGIGIHLWGNGQVRARLFPCMARVFALQSEFVYYTQMVVIRDVARSDEHPLTETVLNCRALFVQFFCDASQGSPFSLAERSDIEQLLLYRANAGLRNYFSAVDALGECKWWSADFLVSINPMMRDYQV